MLKRINVFLWKWFLWCRYASGIRQRHAQFMGWLYDRKYCKVQVMIYPSISTLARTMARVAHVFYRPDGAERLWDSISPPGRFQTFLDNGTVGNETANDCDDFANYIAHALRVSNLPEVCNIRLLVVFWMAKNNLPNGHAVCLFESPDCNSQYAFMDYGYPIYGNSVKELAQQITTSHRGTDLLMWAELDIDTFHADTIKRN